MEIYRYQVSGIRYQVSGIGYRVSGIGYRVSGIGYRVSGLDILAKVNGLPRPYSLPIATQIPMSGAKSGNLVNRDERWRSLRGGTFETVPSLFNEPFNDPGRSKEGGRVVEIHPAWMRAGINSVTLERTKDPRSRRKPSCTHSGPNTVTPQYRNTENPPDTRYLDTSIPQHPDTLPPAQLPPCFRCPHAGGSKLVNCD